MTQLPSRCSSRLTGEKCSICPTPVADHPFGLASDDGGDEQGDVSASVLVVGVGVDDDVGAQAQAVVEAGRKGAGQPKVVGVAHDAWWMPSSSATLLVPSVLPSSITSSSRLSMPGR
jgi:hypothetical protein